MTAEVGFRSSVYEVAAIVRMFASRPFELQGGVKYLEAVGKGFLDPLDEGSTLHALGVHDMRSEGVLAAGEHPDMQIVDADDALHPEDRQLDLDHVNTLGRTFQQDVQAFLEQDPGPRQHP